MSTSDAEPTPASDSAAPAAPAVRIRKSRRRRLGKLAPKARAISVVSRHEARQDPPPHLAWYYRKDTRPAGPFTMEEMVSMMTAGRFGPETLVWSEDVVEDWTPLKDVEVLSLMADGHEH